MYYCKNCKKEIFPLAFSYIKDSYPDSFCSIANCPICDNKVKGSGVVTINNKIWEYNQKEKYESRKA